MGVASQVLAVVFGVALVWVWIVESFLYRRKAFYPLLRIQEQDFEAVKLWNVNLGFYNLTTAVALFLGVWLLNSDHVAAGEALVLFTAGQHLFLSLVLLVTERRLWLNSVMEGTIPVVILVLELV